MLKHDEADLVAEKYLNMQLEAKDRPGDLTVTLAILLIIAALAAAFWIIPDRASSEEENRVLAQFPEFSPESLESGKFTSDFASYMADQFPMRDTFVGIKAAAEISMLKLENNSVMLAPGDTLAERFDTVNTDNVKANTDAINAFCGTLNSRGVTARFALLPRSMDIFDIPVYGRGASEREWQSVRDIAGDGMIDMRSVFDAHSGEYIYYRTDHHYTTLGAYYTYAALGGSLGYTPNSVEHYKRTEASDSFFGTTYSKSGMKWITPDTVEYFRWDGDDKLTVTVAETGEVRDGLYFEEHLSSKDKYASFAGGNFARIDIARPGEVREKLLIVKDSFAHALVPFLAEHFDITMIDTRYYKRPVIKLAEDEGFSRVLVLCNLDTLSSAKPFEILRMGLK